MSEDRTIRRTLTMKPAFMADIMAFPPDRLAVLMEKLSYLLPDPFPDGRLKKKLQGSDDVYRIRVGDHRVFYRFGSDWVSLLALRPRNEATYRVVPSEEGVPATPDEDDDEGLEELLAPRPPVVVVVRPSAPVTQTPLPRELTLAFLQGVGVPAKAVTALRACRNEDDLLNAAIPPETLQRVLDALYPKALAEVEQQPDLFVPDTEDLVRYRQGTLLGFLLNLDASQKKLTRWALKGPTMVKGGAGTGKSTVALYRVKEVLERRGASKTETVLFTTYTTALINVTTQLLRQLLSPQQLTRVRVATCDQIARELVAKQRRVGTVESNFAATGRLRELRRTFQPQGTSAFEARLRTRALERLSDAYLFEEFEWVIEGRGLKTLDAYRDAPRPGRGIAFNERLREVVWELYTQFTSGAGGERFSQLRDEALTLARDGKAAEYWDYVLVDEAQDLSPVSLMLMAELCKTDEGIFFAADNKQSIYSRNYSWSAVHPRLQFQGRTAVLKRNYRSTREIDRAAFGVLHAEDGENYEGSESVHEGPIPVLVRGVDVTDEAEWIARFIREMTRHLHLKTSAAAVLVPSNAVGELLAQQLENAGLATQYFKGKDLDLEADVVKVITLHSAKGLEFPVVVVAGFHPGTYSVAEDFNDMDLHAERMRNERRLLYVGLTRAMRGLMVMVPADCRHEALLGLNEADWHVEYAQ